MQHYEENTERETETEKETETEREKEVHCVALSMSDGSFWCYECDSYVFSPELREIALVFSSLKFPDGESNPFEAISGTPSFVSDNASPSEDSAPSFSREELIKGLRAKQFQNVAVLTGAGISVAAGIPDFRTPGSGLYSKVAELGLPRPESIFSLDYFTENPVPFSKIAKQFLLDHQDLQPVHAHKFIKALHDHRQLLLNYTQNIDGLELKAGLPLHKLVQAHGHMRTAHCPNCSASCPIEDFLSACENESALLCTSCEEGHVKPDIVFFGEKLPQEFHFHYNTIEQADLVIVMGTSLKVYPFAFLLAAVGKNVPIVLINRENPGVDHNKFLFLEGEIEENVKFILEEWLL